MKVSVVGSGNVAAALAMELAANNCFNSVDFVARDVAQLSAIVGDAASAFPTGVRNFRISDSLTARESEIIVVTAGMQIPPGGTAVDVHLPNVEIALGFLSGHVSPTTKVVLVGTPVDLITGDVAASLKLEPTSVIGFGGDLDVRRLVHVLHQRQISCHSAFLIGEHGSKAIPVYEGEANYGDVAAEVRFFLKKISHDSGRPRNLASGVLLARLLKSLCCNTPQLHHVVTYCQEFELFLTWPTLLSSAGVVGRHLPTLEANARRDLEALVENRRSGRTKP